MLLRKIRLSNFRNFKDKVFEFSENTTIIVGPNASGKTNILESIFLLSTGKSLKAGVEEEMIHYDEEVARVKGKVDSQLLEAMLTRGVIERGGITERVARKKLLVDGVGKRLIDFSGNLKAVFFRPSDLDLVTESPSIRRKFLDTVLSQVDYEYRRSLLSYEKGLRRRNKLLILIREEGVGRNQLYFWDKLLIKNGNYITQKRQELVDFVNLFPNFTGNDYMIEYDRSVISETRIAQYSKEEVAAGTTLVGPHRDDIIFKLKERELDKYASRGEQRMAVLWTKIAESAFIEKFTSVRPLLLLDDIFSELDHNHRDVVFEAMENRQTILTTADHHFIEGFNKASIINLAK